MRIGIPAILIMSLLLLGACMPVQPESPPTEVATVYVGPELLDCVGVGPQKCMQVKTEPDADYQYFYDQIEGFDYEEGYEYELSVQVESVENPPADASSIKYTLIEIVDKRPVD